MTKTTSRGPARPPAPPKKGRSKQQQAEQAKRKAAFLEAMQTEIVISGAAKKAGVGVRTVHDWQQADPRFKADLDDVQEGITQALEREAVKRAVEGSTEDIYHQGKVVGAVQKKSDLLLIFLLKAKRPLVYRDNVKHEVSVDGPVTLRWLDE